MKLNAFTDYSLRTLIYLALPQSGVATRAQIATAYGISDNHLMKVVNFLAQQGYLATQRGKGGGIRLARPATEIRLGDLVRLCEQDVAMVECFDVQGGCRIDGLCGLKHALAEANEAMIASMNRYTLQDIIHRAEPLIRILGIQNPLA